VETAGENGVRAVISFRVLGPLEAISEDGPLPLGGPQQRAVLALLLLHANEVVARERLIDELWGDAPPPTARDTVKVYVARLRKILDKAGGSGSLATRNGSYILQLEPDQLDLEQFLRLAERGARALAKGDPATAAAALREALALWRGPPLVDLVDAPFARNEQHRLEELRVAAIEDRIDADLALRRASAVVPEVWRLVREHPYRERLWRQLMLALYASGRQAEALATYQDARKMLVDQLGIEPSNELRRLEQAILTHDPSLDSAAGAERTAVAPRTARMRGRLVLVVAALVVVAIFAALLAARDSTVHVTPNSVAVIDPVTNKLIEDISVGRAPGLVVAAADRVSVANTADTTVMDIDPNGRTVRRTIPLDARPTALAADADGTWLLTGAQTAGSPLELARIDGRFGAVGSRTAEIGIGSQGAARQPLAVGMGSIWAPGRLPGTLVRRDPKTLAWRATVELAGHAVAALAPGFDAMWAVTTDNRLLRIDPETNRVIEDHPTGGRPLDVAVGGNAVWVASWSDDVVVRWDPIAHSEISIAVGDGPVAVAFGFGSVWIACSGDGTIWRIDPASREVVADWKLGASPEDIAAGAGAVWAAVYSELPP
jgi:DNA-binding SARP family transcriptional activator/DNA-binding beta-propeller fold protein YncE